MRLLFFSLLATLLVICTWVTWNTTHSSFWFFSSGETVSHSIPFRAVLFTGDVFLGRAVERWQYQNVALSPFDYLQSVFDSYEKVLINFESAIPQIHTSTPDYGYTFSVSTTTAALLAEYGITHAGIANNHTFDFGKTGFTHTITSLANSGIIPLGASYDPTFIQTSGGQIAVVAVNTVGVNYDRESIVAAVETAQQSGALPVVFIHWGEEYTPYPSNEQRRLAEELTTAGARLIIGHHPHVVQTVEEINGAVVFYSLGNTVFDQYFSKDVQQGLLLGLENASGKWVVRLWPITSLQTRHQPQLLFGAAQQELLKAVADISDPLLYEAIIAGLIPLP